MNEATARTDATAGPRRRALTPAPRSAGRASRCLRFDVLAQWMGIAVATAIAASALM
jgi:hypothetical protein